MLNIPILVPDTLMGPQQVQVSFPPYACLAGTIFKLSDIQLELFLEVPACQTLPAGVRPLGDLGSQGKRQAPLVAEEHSRGPGCQPLTIQNGSLSKIS